MRLLLIEDEEDAARMIAKALMREQYSVDVMGELREAGSATPILMLTASDAYEDRVKGLDLGADDYLVKPFDLNELLARVRALLRRKPLLQDSIIRIDTLEIDTRSRTVKRGGEFVRVTAKEYGLLECLARDADTMLSREDISQRVWNESYDPLSNLIEEYIKRVRKKIELEGHKPLIYARRGEGYILTAKEFS